MSIEDIKKDFEEKFGLEKEEMNEPMVFDGIILWNFIETKLTEQGEELIKKIEGMAFDKESSDITQEYQSVFLDGYNQAIEEVVESLSQQREKGKIE